MTEPTAEDTLAEDIELTHKHIVSVDTENMMATCACGYVYRYDLGSG